MIILVSDFLVILMVEEDYTLKYLNFKKKILFFIIKEMLIDKAIKTFKVKTETNAI